MARRAGGRKATSKRRHWTVEDARQLLEACDCSGLTMAAFCRQRGIRPERLYWWRNRFAVWSQGPEPTEQLAPLAPGTASAQHLIEAVMVPSSPAYPSAVVVLHLLSGDSIDVLSSEHVAADWPGPENRTEVGGDAWDCTEYKPPDFGVSPPPGPDSGA